MDFRTIIATRRDAGQHSSAELDLLAQQAALPADHPDRFVPDYQLSAWLMACVHHPLSISETAHLTMAMAKSGERLDLNGLPKPWVDKHSTGGVGDKTTLVLLPLLACCGLTMVKMSGRGLGITGGTIDKLESIPGFRTDLTPEEMKAQASQIGIALTGQTPRLAPADGALYALRNATETVMSIPLIASSILSKKIAGGAELVVIDLKVGRGAFMKTLDQARQLADCMLAVAAECGLKLKVVLTDMNNMLGSTAGNALEVWEAFSVLRGERKGGRFDGLCRELASIALHESGKCASPELARETVDQALEPDNSAETLALRKAKEWVAAQCGDLRVFDADFSEWRTAPVSVEIRAERSGVLSEIDAESVGRLVVELGGGRKKKGDTVDHRVGVDFGRFEVGSRVEKGEVVARIVGGGERTLRDSQRLSDLFRTHDERQNVKLESCIL